MKLASKLNLFVKLYRNKIKLKNNLEKELKLLYNLTSSILLRLEESTTSLIISNNEYKAHMSKLYELIHDLENMPDHFTIKFIYEYSQYKLLLFIAKIKLKYINIVQKIGCSNIKLLAKLFINIDTGLISPKYLEIYEFYETVFKPTGCDIYDSIDATGNSFKLNECGNDSEPETQNITLADFEINIPTCNKMAIFTKSDMHKLYGGKLYIPYCNKLLIIYGYFVRDDIGIYRSLPYLKGKVMELDTVFDKLGLPTTFKTNFQKQISLRDFILLNTAEIISECSKAYVELVEIKKRDIAQLIKYFILNDIIKQRYIITVLVLDEDDTQSHYLAYMLYDLIQSDSSVTYSNYNKFLASLHWTVQKLFQNSKKSVNKINNNLLQIDEMSIPYEKRINLMKASDTVKSKALDKLKEVNNSKGGETNAKAQQYVDGILKIPFGVYKRDKINILFSSTLVDINTSIGILQNVLVNMEEHNCLNYNSLHFIDQLKIILLELKDTPKNSVLYNISTFKLRDMIQQLNCIEQHAIIINKLSNKEDYQHLLGKYTVARLRELCQVVKLPKNGLKRDIINRISEHEIPKAQFLLTFAELYNNNQISIVETDGYDMLLKNIDDILKLWGAYKSKEKEHLQYINTTLDKAVYGLDGAKQQIKRIFAQWMTGKSKGYVLGFEGSPGTGKTTLAKKGISMCLLDENDTPRPFMFMAVGGSSNGSTLEGHNYTYVGSQWGNIVGSLMDAKCMNPIIYIDELDKISKTEHGKELIGILTHMTDTGQNDEFADKYFSGIKFDISKCLIIFSYNNPENIDKVLLNRIQRIKIPPLSKYDKLVVSKKHILPEIYSDIGILDEYIIWDDEILYHLIQTYTCEAGARKVKEILYDIIRQINLDYLNDLIEYPYKITKEYVDAVLFDNPKMVFKKINDRDMVGLVNGLYASNNSLGGITIIETFKTPSNNFFELTLTGQQGDVMKESMQCAKTLVFNMLPLTIIKKLKTMDKFSIHIHCPDTATPKDGPSAGTAITLGILSLLTGNSIKREFALTGEIDLNGYVRRIGGLKAKVYGAKHAGVKTVLCPEENRDDLEKIRADKNAPEDDNFQIICISTIYDAVKYMMNGDTSIFLQV